MKRNFTTITEAMVLMALLVLSPLAAFACPVPVFRYALDRWPPDYYDAALIHQGPITEDQNQLWDQFSAEDDEGLNVRLSKIDIASVPDDKVEGLFGGETPETLPVLALWYPWARGRMPPVWLEQFTPETVTALAKSPVRKELAERLSEGQAAVWLFLKSGDAEKDKASLKLIEQELKAATKELTETPSPFIDESMSPGLSYEFSVLAFDRSDPNERVLLAMLLNSEPNLDEYADDPIVFPVFGRGRSLYALVGAGINAGNIREAIGFLTGPCGCEIKAMNPGVDMLVAANWDQAVMALYEEVYYETAEAVPELTSVFPESPEVTDSEPSVVEVTDNEAPALAGNEQEQVMAQPAEIKEQEAQPVKSSQPAPSGARQLGVAQTTAVCLTIILVAVVLGTLAMTRQRREHP